MKSNNKLTLALAISGLMASGAANAVQYHFVMPMDGMIASSEPSAPEATPNVQDSTYAELVAKYPMVDDPETGWRGIDAAPDFSVFQVIGGQDALGGLEVFTNLPAELYPYTAGTIIDIQNTNLSDISSLSSITYPNVMDLRGNKINDISPLSSMTMANEVNLSGNSFENVDALVAFEEVAGQLRLENNPNLVDLSGLSDSAGASNPGGRIYPISNMSGDPFLYIDSGISSRAGFVPISGTSYACETSAASMYAGNVDPALYATQSEVCESTWTL